MPAWADAGVPMLVLVWPASWVLLIPIIFVEAEIARSMLVLPYGRAFEVAGLANLASTFLGIPLTWGALVLVEILTGLIAWGLHPLGVATPGEASSSAWWDSVWWNIVALPLTGRGWAILPIFIGGCLLLRYSCVYRSTSLQLQ